MWFVLKMFLELARFTAPVAFLLIWYAAITGTGAFAMADEEGRYARGVAASLVPVLWFLMSMNYARQERRFDADEALRYKYLAGLGWSLVLMASVAPD